MNVDFRMTPMICKLEEILKIILVICLCTTFGCRSTPRVQSSSTFSTLALEPPNSDTDVPPSQWSAEIRSLKPIKVYRDVGHLVVVQRKSNGVESGKYIIEVTSSTAGQSGKFIWLNPVVLDGFPTASAYEYVRRQGNKLIGAWLIIRGR